MSTGARVSVLIVATAFTLACGGEPPQPPPRPPAVTAIDCEGGTPLDVPSDSRARYCILKRGGTAARPTIVTKRAGSSGISYARREYDCARSLYRYLGEGNTRAQMDAGYRDPPRMTEIVEGSITSYVSREACAR